MLLPTGTPAAVTMLSGGTEGEGSDGAEGAEVAKRLVQPWGPSVPRASNRRLPSRRRFFCRLRSALPTARSIRLGSARGCWLRGLPVLQAMSGDRGTRSGRGRAAPCC